MELKPFSCVFVKLVDIPKRAPVTIELPEVVKFPLTFSTFAVAVPVKVGLACGALKASSFKMLVPSTTKS